MSRPAVGIKLNAPIVDVRWSDIRDMARVADDGPFHSLWSEDHQFGPRRGGDPWEVWSVLSALAAVTRRVYLGPIVASTNFHSPLILARKAAAVQEVSAGRLIFGLGAGSLPAEYPKAGLPFDHPVSRFEESFAVMRRLFAGERFSFEGSYYRLEDTWLANVSENPIEWMVGSLGPRMLGITLPHVQGWNVHWGDEPFFNRPAGYRQLSDRFTELCQGLGFEPDRYWRSAEIYVKVAGAHGLPVDLPPEFESIGGDAAAIAESLDAFAEEGVDLLQVLVDPQTAAAVEALAEAVALLD
ncbi:MAG TPA: LLM class flavin-dependent oxidoreductase [Candidatus Limnocylindria bacterium]|nr:LLM class flavin-dependent oxidoreductase [Candidatus Limnocylindria bacterium]